MPIYTHDPAAVSATFFVFPKDEYEFKVGRPKAFERTAAGGHQSYGIRFPLTCTQGPQAGKKTIFTIYLHTDGAAGMGKRFQMAASGFEVNDRNQQDFDQECAGRDWSYNTDTGEVGSGWLEYEGVSVVCDVDQQPQKDKDGNEVKDKHGEVVMSQTFETWRPVEGAMQERETPAEVGAR